MIRERQRLDGKPQPIELIPQRLQPLQLVAKDRGALELKRVARRLHQRLQPLDGRLIVSLQEGARLAHTIGIDRRQRRPADSFEELAFEPRPQWTTLATKEDPQDRSERLELARALSIALERLQEEQRLVVILSDVQGYSYDEIAAITGISLGTVKSRLSRGRGRLREILRELPGGAELFARYRRRYEEGVEG